MRKSATSVIFLTLGIVWIFGGLLLYPESGIWPLGIIFFIIGMIIRTGSIKL